MVRQLSWSTATAPTGWASIIGRTPGLHGGDAKVVDGGGIDAASIAYWTEGSFSYALTTSRTADWLDRNAEALHATISGQARDLAAAP